MTPWNEMTNRIYILLHIESSSLWLWASTLMREYFAHFLADLGKSCHNLEKKHKTQVQTPCLQALRRWPMGSAVFFIMSFGFLESFTDLGKGCQNFEKTKKNCRPYVWRLWGDASWGLQFFVFLVLSRYMIFDRFGQRLPRLPKPREKKTADPMSGGIEEMPRGVCSFVFFLEDFVTCYDLIFSRCSQIHLLWLDIQQMVTDALNCARWW